MVNLAALNYELDKSGLKRRYVAEQMGITLESLGKKLTGKSEFKLSEADSFCNAVGIPVPKRRVIFFRLM